MSSAVRALRSPRRADPERPVSLQVVEARHRRRRTGLVVSIGLALVFGTLLAVAGFQARLVEGQSRLDRLNRSVAQDQARLDRLRLKVATLTAPEYIVARAKSFGMTAPVKISFIRPEGNSVVEVHLKGLSTGWKADVVSVAAGSAWPTVKQVERSTP